MSDDILLTILCVTYNHYNYIRDALDSVFHQQVNFKYEMVVHDDASTDGTTDILREYEEKYHDKIKVLYEAENQYQKVANFDIFLQETMLPFVRGKYVLMFEGDDYLIDDTKLQRQVDYLEENPDCMMVAHNAAILNMTNVKVDILTKYYSDKNLSPEEVINHPYGYMATASMVMRKECYESNGLFSEAGVGDYPRQLSCLARGKIHYIDRVMSVYRFGHSGSWQELQDKNFFLRFCGYLKMIRFLDKYNIYTNFVYNRYVRKEIQRYANRMIAITNKENIDKMLTRESHEESYWKYVDCIKRIFDQIKNGYYLDDLTKEFMQKHKHILIMGAGKYAAILAEQLKNNDRDFDGFVISPNQDSEPEYLNKPVYKLNKIPYKMQETGILIGINAEKLDEVEDTLLQYQISYYYCPFLLDPGYKQEKA